MTEQKKMFALDKLWLKTLGTIQQKMYNLGHSNKLILKKQKRIYIKKQLTNISWHYIPKYLKAAWLATFELLLTQNYVSEHYVRPRTNQKLNRSPRTNTARDAKNKNLCYTMVSINSTLLVGIHKSTQNFCLHWNNEKNGNNLKSDHPSIVVSIDLICSQKSLI